MFTRAALAPQADIALKHAERAKALKPDLDCVRTALARALVRSARPSGKAHSEARISLLERALAEQDDPKTWYRLGRARREAKDLAGAADAFEKCGGDDARGSGRRAAAAIPVKTPLSSIWRRCMMARSASRAPLGRARSRGAGIRRGERPRHESTEGLGLWLRHGPLGPRVVRCRGLFKAGRRRPLRGHVREGARHGAFTRTWPRASSVRIAASFIQTRKLPMIETFVGRTDNTRALHKSLGL